VAIAAGQIQQLEQRLEAVLASQPVRFVRGVPSVAGGDQQDGACGAVLQQHRDACPRLDGLPITFHMTGGEVSDTTQLQISLDIGPDITPRVGITD
jgi:hypothetical protein